MDLGCILSIGELKLYAKCHQELFIPRCINRTTLQLWRFIYRQIIDKNCAEVLHRPLLCRTFYSYFDSRKRTLNYGNVIHEYLVILNTSKSTGKNKLQAMYMVRINKNPNLNKKNSNILPLFAYLKSPFSSNVLFN